MLNWIGQIYKDNKRVGQLWNMGQYSYRAEIEVRNMFFSDSYESVVQKLNDMGYEIRT